MKILKPTRGGHDGSSFREMLDIWKERGYCEVIDNTNIQQGFGDETQWISSRPWINSVGDIMLYDNPLLDKIHPGLTWNLALFCNEVMKGPKCSTWTFWPNHPKAHEKIRNEGIPKYNQRKNESCFIGSYTTAYRNNYSEWGE